MLPIDANEAAVSVETEEERVETVVERAETEAVMLCSVALNAVKKLSSTAVLPAWRPCAANSLREAWMVPARVRVSVNYCNQN